jgi:energy-coupling factor transporter ATP-binding protein EcfA2
MILEEITIANWRSFREPHTFRFEQGLNVLVGANEAGKSTLFEALARAFFDRHGSGAEEIKQMRPLGSSQGPEVTVTFEANGIRHKVWKRFLTDPAARLSVERNGHWEVDHENEQADARVRLVMSGKEYSRATKAEHRGLAEALWYLQRDSSLPEKDWSEAVQQGLAGLVRQVVRSPREAVMLGNLVRL